MSNKRKINSYTTEFKKSSAKLAVESDQFISQTTRELGIHGFSYIFYHRIHQNITDRAILELVEEKNIWMQIIHQY